MSRLVVRSAMVGILLPSLLPYAFADNYSVQKALDSFYKDSPTFMNQRIKKYEQRFSSVENDEEGIFQGEFEIPGKNLTKEQMDRLIDAKNSYHEGLRQKRNPNQGKAPWEPNDNAADLVEGMERYPNGLRVTSLEQMERKHLLSGKSSVHPWSDDYWPIYQGGAARRYTDANLPDTNDWQRMANYIYKETCSIDDLSPTEKYDLLIGDKDRTLTIQTLAAGMGYAEGQFNPGAGFTGASKEVETWMGHCDGWAQASYMEKRPSRATTVLAADGRTKITFYPSDIKALATLLWAKSGPQTRFIGQRCEKKDPPTDAATGRVLDTECFDTNPGTWHLAVINQLGINKRPFVIDATYDYEVWNQPVYSYSYSYFNPKTQAEVSRLSEARVNVGDPGFADKFARWRSPDAKSIVGVAMKLVYIKETAPSHDKYDKPSKDYKVAVNYLYDLELDASGRIIGGEWYQNLHPDFMWTPARNASANSDGDIWLNRQGDRSGWHFKNFKSVPANWITAAKQYSSPEGQPLAKIVDALIERSGRYNFIISGR